MRIRSFSSTSFSFFLTNLKLLKYNFTFFSFFEVISASANCIKSSIFSPASNKRRRTAESVTTSWTRAIGRKCKPTRFWTYFNFSFKGNRKFLNISSTILAPVTSCPWNDHPFILLKCLVAGLPISCKSAAHLNHKSFDKMLIWSTTCKVWAKLSLCILPSIFSTPFSWSNWGKKIAKSPVSSSISIPTEGLGESIILLNSSIILSIETIFNLSALTEIALKVSFSISKPSWEANLIALTIRKGSSLKVITGSRGVRIILFCKSSNPLNESITFPKSFLLKDAANALIVKSLRDWSSANVPFSIIGFRELRW